MSEPSGGQINAPKNWPKKLGDFRDPLLVLASVIYGVGYFVWSIHAYSENLGLLPALEPQYLIAGIIPVLMLWIAWQGRRIPRRCTDWIAQRVAQAKGWQKQAHLILGIVLLVGGYYLLSLGNKFSVVPGMTAQAARWQIVKENVCLALAYLLMVPGFLFLGATFFAKVLMYFVTLVYVSAFLVGYVFSIYPNIPQEFGGVRPRCAHVDITRNQISDSMQKAILPDAPPKALDLAARDSVTRSIRLKAYFADKEIMLVRPDGTDSHSPVIEIKKSVVQAITWCD